MTGGAGGGEERAALTDVRFREYFCLDMLGGGLPFGLILHVERRPTARAAASERNPLPHWFSDLTCLEPGFRTRRRSFLWRFCGGRVPRTINLACQHGLTASAKVDTVDVVAAIGIKQQVSRQRIPPSPLFSPAATYRLSRRVAYSTQGFAPIVQFPATARGSRLRVILRLWCAVFCAAYRPVKVFLSRLSLVFQTFGLGCDSAAKRAAGAVHP